MNWLFFGQLRLVSIGLFLTAKTWLDYNHYNRLFYAFLFCHYLFQFLYSGKQLKSLLVNRPFWLASLFLSLLCLFSILTNTPQIELAFGLHFVLTEVYAVRREKKPIQDKVTTQFIMLRFVLYGLGYLWLTLGLPTEKYLSSNFLTVVFACSVIPYLYYYRQIKDYFQTDKKDLLVFDILGIVMILWAPKFGVHFQDLVFYHLIWWWFYPLQNKPSRNLLNIAQYSFLTILVTGFFYQFTPEGYFTPWASLDQLYKWAIPWAYIHIYTAFALSRDNPNWILKKFYVRNQNY